MMMDLAQLETAARKCETKLQALELVRRETASRLTTFENISEADARTATLANIAYVTGNGMPREEAARVMALFGVAHPYFGGDIDKWPKTPEETILLGQTFGVRARLGENPFFPVQPKISAEKATKL